MNEGIVFQSQHTDEVTARGAFFKFHTWARDLIHKMIGKWIYREKGLGSGI